MKVEMRHMKRDGYARINTLSKTDTDNRKISKM